VTTARVLFKLVNAVICLENYGIVHRDLRPSRVLVDHLPKLQVKLYGFNFSASYLDEDTYPHVKPLTIPLKALIGCVGTSGGTYIPSA
jgi:serine/threonine protein kinase